ncbi:helix-turn-helix transcriptional regulator [Solwaraspora sp. WMMD1047]|uniref:helix-turn-helix domain-containing protein n=1 Tax=Solwaraspora sp. WMMD1047 TaxID=3016102 RepID=UPI002415E633|nr:helix-turn-helix transcriptional regulator [Solwaraspora sp. WMMD1047]MDG4833644.1 helix-turn-helix transcriptional regulator [Solwaraspora sp. WMMD1047]
MPTPKDLPRDVGGFIRDLRRNAKISLRQLAEQAGVSNPYLSQIERGLRKPSAEVLQQLASALRVSTPVMYLRAGLLDDPEGHGVLASIAADPDLTMAQKQSLSQIYETFRRENARQAEEEPTGPQPSAPAPTTPTEAVLESVAVTEAGAAAPPPTSGTDPTASTDPTEDTSKPARKAARRAASPASRTAPAVEEENQS